MIARTLRTSLRTQGAWGKVAMCNRGELGRKMGDAESKEASVVGHLVDNPSPRSDIADNSPTDTTNILILYSLKHREVN